MTYAIEMARAQADTLCKEREAYAKEGEAEFWDGVCGRMVERIYGDDDPDDPMTLEEIMGEAARIADNACVTRRQARLRRWDEDHSTDWSDLAESGASKEDIEAAITAATGRPADLSKGE